METCLCSASRTTASARQRHVLTFKIHFYDLLTAYITIILLYMRTIGNLHCAVTGAGSKSIWKIAQAKPTVTALDVA
jgi:hypothetical protein